MKSLGPAMKALVAVCVLGSALVACSCGPKGESGDGSTPATPAASAATRQVRFASVWVDDPRKPTLEAIAADFRAEHPDIDLKLEYTAPDPYKQQIRTAAGADDLPDVFFVWPAEFLGSFVEGGKVLDLTDELAKDGWGDSFIPASMPLLQFEGRQYAVPMLMQAKYFLYNKQAFADRGLSIPSTWEEFTTVCDAFAAEGVAPIGLGNKEKWPLHHYVVILWQRLVGEDQLLEDYASGAFEDPGYLEGLNMLQGMIDKGYFTENANGTDRDAFRMLFITGRAPMIYSGTWNLGYFQDPKTAGEGFADEWDMFLFPSIPDGKGDPAYMMGAQDAYAVSAKAQDKEAALTWLRYLTSKETAERLVQGLQELVCVKGSVNENTAGEKLRHYARDLEAAPGITPWADVMLEASVREVFLDAMQGMLDHTVTPEQVLESLRAAHAEARGEG